jgi:hypothetical protein
VKNPSRLALFISLYFIFSNIFATGGLIDAKSSIFIQNIPKNDPWINLPLSFQHYLTSGLTFMIPSKLACSDSLLDNVVMLPSVINIYSKIVKPEVELRLPNHIPLQVPYHHYIVEASNGPDLLAADISCIDPYSNTNQNLREFSFQNVAITNQSEKLPYVVQLSEIGPNIGALAAMGTDGAILNGTNVRSESNIIPNSYYDVRGVNIGALAAVAANKAIIDATITQLNGSAITINVANNTIQKGNNQSISITLMDKLTKKGLQNSSIDGWITDSSGISMDFFSGLTNSSGMMSSSLKIGIDATPGKATVFVEAYHRGYQRSAKSASFQITP